MSKTIGQFDYSITQFRKNDPMPFNPFVVICLQQWGATASDGAPLISANLMTDDEIDFHIRQLKEDLDAVGARAKRSLAKAIDETRALSASRSPL